MHISRSVKTKSSGSLVRYKHCGRGRGSAYRQTNRTNVLCHILLSLEGPWLLQYVLVFLGCFFAFQTDTRMCSLFHPLDEFQPATTAFASERDCQPSAKRITSGIARIAIASNYKRPSTSSSFLYNFYCTSSATLQNLFLLYCLLYIFSAVLECLRRPSASFPHCCSPPHPIM